MMNTGPCYITAREVRAITPKVEIIEVHPTGRSTTRTARITDPAIGVSALFRADVNNTEIVELDDPISVRCRKCGEVTVLTLRTIADEVLPNLAARRSPAAT